MDAIIRGANWYIAEKNQRLRLESVKLPELSREMAKYAMAGGFFSIELPQEIAPLTAEASYNGSHEDVRGFFGREPGDWITCTYYESLQNIFPKDNTTGPSLKGRVVILKGLLNHVTQPSVSGLKAVDKTVFRWSSIITYHDLVDSKTVHKFDVENNELVINGVNYTARHNRLLAANG